MNENPINLHDLLRIAASRPTDSCAMFAEDRLPATYQQLLLQVDCIGLALRQLGLSRSARVAIALPGGPDLAVAALGVATYATCAPLNPNSSADELEFCFKDIGVQAVIVPNGVECTARKVAQRKGLVIVDLETLPNQVAGTFHLQNLDIDPNNASDWGQDEDIAILLHTSGTTARPKLVPLSHRQLCVSARNIADVLQLSPSDRCLCVMPLYHIHGLSTLFASIAAKASVVCSHEFSADRMGELVTKFHPTWYSASPALHRMILDHLDRDRHGNALRSFRFLRSASAPMPLELLSRLEQVFAAPMIEAYGMTEAAPQIASNKLSPEERRLGSVGRAAGPEVAIMDMAGNLLSHNETGEVVIRGQNVITAYENQHSVDEKAFVRGWLRTGDEGRIDQDGFLFVSGRLNDIINRGGEKISPQQVDEVMQTHPDVAESVTFAVPHPVLGENVGAAVVLKPDTQRPDRNGSSDAWSAAKIRELQQFVAKRLAHFKIPQQILFVDQIPRSSTGKVRRRELAKQLELQFRTERLNSGKQHSAVEMSPLERCIAEIWAGVLRIDLPGNHDNFFQLGGESLSVVRVANRLSQFFCIDVTLQALFERPTVAGQAEMIGNRLANLVAEGRLRVVSPEAAPGASKMNRRIHRRRDAAGSAPMSFSQQRLWVLDQMGAGAAYHMSASLRLQGPLDVPTLQRSLEELCLRHETLRTTFHMEDDELIQRVSPVSQITMPLLDLTKWLGADRETAAMRFVTEQFTQAFDLASGPLFRAALVRLTDNEHYLSLTMHHIISDGWSTQLLHRELCVIYDAYRQGLPSPLSDLPIQFVDFSVWQRQRLRDGEFAQDISYWRQQLDRIPPLIKLPTDRSRPATQSHQGATHHSVLTRQLLSRVEAIGSRAGATLFMTLLAAFKTLLFRHSGQEDLVVGVPIANRTLVETENLIGFFANTLALRTDLSGNPTFQELLDRVRATSLGAFAHQELPFDKLVELINPSRDLSYVPMVQVMFAFQNLKDGSEEMPSEWSPGLTASPLAIGKQTAKFDLTLYISESSEGLNFAWQYNIDLFDAATIEQLAARYQTLLLGIVDDPQRRLSELPILSEAKRVRNAATLKPTEISPVRTGGIVHLFEDQAERTPDALAILCGDEQMTYCELNARANQLARRLRHHGVVPGMMVGVCLFRSTEMVVSLLAILKAGGAFVPFDPNYPTARLAVMLADSQVSLLVTEQRLLASLPTDVANVFCWDSERERIDSESRQNLETTFHAMDLAYAIFTSGTTGRPKAALITQANLSHYVQAMREALNVSAGDCYLHTASFAFSSSVRQFAVPLCCGATVVIAKTEEVRDPVLLFDLVRNSGVTILDLVPSYWRGCLKALEPLPSADRVRLLANRVRLIVSASEPLPTDLPSAWSTCVGRRVSMINLYGQTETTGIVATYPIPASLEEPTPYIPIGRPIANTHAYVLDAAQQPVPVGVEGELYIGGAGVGLGYLNRPDLTAERFLPNPFHDAPVGRMFRTGDRARIRSSGILELLGRIDDQIKVRGFRVEPGEIEAILRQHPRVSDSVVIATGGQDSASDVSRLVAFVVPTDDFRGREDGTSELRAYLKQTLPDYMVPSAIIELGELPQTPTGKTDRKLLAKKLDPIVSGKSVPTDLSVPSDSLVDLEGIRSRAEGKLIEIWRQILRIDTLHIDQNFFDAGGDSILAIQVIARAKQAGLDLDLRQFYQHQTIRELAAVIVDRLSRHRLAGSTKVANTEIIVTVASLRAFGQEALERAGLAAEGARIVTEVQLEASLRGQLTHHIGSIPRYARRITAGKINPRPRICVELETAISAKIDGDNGPGQWVGAVAMQTAIEKSQTAGVGIVTVRRSNHFGAAGHYAWQAAQAGRIGLCTTNGPVILAPTGGITPTFGNNPLAAGIPAGKHRPILLDIALSVAPRGKIGLHLAAGKPLPPGWIMDRFGRHSTNLADLASGLGVPIGEHKGYGLTMVMEILSGVLSGAAFGWDHCREQIRQYAQPPDIGHFFIAIDPQLFLPFEEFTARVDKLIDQAKGGERAEQVDEILIPGESELRARERSLSEGVRLSADTYQALRKYAAEAGLATDLEVVKNWDLLENGLV